MKLDMEKPGAKKLFQYLQGKSDGTVSINDYKEIDQKWTKKRLVRIAEEHPNIFLVDDEKVTLVKNDKDLENIDNKIHHYKGIREVFSWSFY
ncbi:MAG: hypothetical protein LRY71_01075 [Bacillaceae bacterium]|nr:hypothetical protein [Bacillaceae bacterium]